MKNICYPMGGVEYSTTERVVGKWMGKPIYQKTYYLLHQSVGSDIGYVNIDTSDINPTLQYMVNLQGNADFLSSNLRTLISGNFYFRNSDNHIMMIDWTYSSNGIGINTQMKHPSATYSDFNFYATIQYTKTTD